MPLVWVYFKHAFEQLKWRLPRPGWEREGCPRVDASKAEQVSQLETCTEFEFQM